MSKTKYRQLVESIEQQADLRRGLNASEDEMINLLCQQIGYGAVMDSAARQWQRIDPVGAFTVGPCLGTIRSVLARKKEQPAHAD